MTENQHLWIGGLMLAVSWLLLIVTIMVILE